MGGFWPSAATALANRTAGDCGNAGGTAADAVRHTRVESAIVWQAWQAAQDSQCPPASWVIGSEAWSAACPLQLKEGAVKCALGSFAASPTVRWEECPSALVSWALTAIISVATDTI